ncbi:MAG: hypothetical protein ACE5LC_07995 [Candidatus Aminicenantales bacterium]
MFDYIFAFFHLFLLLALLVYGILSLFYGNLLRFGLILVSLVLYYILVLHKGVKEEIKRKQKKKKT